jgi:thioredoxin
MDKRMITKAALMSGLPFVCIFFFCAQVASEKKVAGAKVPVIRSAAELTALLDSSGSALLMLDLYADWCMPCRTLSPILEKISADMKSSVAVYKINIDKNPDIAALFNVLGIPFVVLVKEKKAVQSFMGVQPEAVYRRAIAQHSVKGPQERKDQPDGELVNGVRVITLNTSTTVGNLYVYRGEEVRLVFEKVDFPYSVHIPALKASGSAAAGERLSIEFKAKETGVFSMMCNGKCPVGDGQQFAKIVVLEYDVEDAKAIFKSITPKKAGEMIATDKPLILDVRTPSEFYAERIPNSMLIPVQQLADRIGELGAYKDKPILVYCRSGNRSIPASQILIRNGFKKVYNMQHGIGGWTKDNLPVERSQE